MMDGLTVLRLRRAGGAAAPRWRTRGGAAPIAKERFPRGIFEPKKLGAGR